MRRLFENKLVVFLVAATIVLAVIIGVFASRDRDNSVAEEVGGAVTASVQEAVSETGGFFSNIFGYFGSVKSLRAENEKLRNENNSLQKQIRDMDGLDKENSELRKMLDLRKKQTNIDMLAATVISKDPSNWYSTFSINKGSKDGVEKNQAIVNSGRELIGQVLRVDDSWAEVITILDSQSAIGAMVGRSKEIGIIEGDASLRLSGECRLGYIARTADVQIGDFVETSGLGGIFPKGLVIGTVKEVYDENATMSRAAIITPLADISKTNEVFVITGYDESDLTEMPESEDAGNSDENEDEDNNDNSEDSEE